MVIGIAIPADADEPREQGDFVGLTTTGQQWGWITTDGSARR
ncbi:hypothetical protein [Microbacterium sp. TWP3-1-2b2]